VNRTERLHALTESLRRPGTRGRTADGLAEEFKVTTRTIKRDLAALQAGGLPVWGRTGPGGGYGLAQGSTLPPVNFTAAQALALSAAVAVSIQAPFSDAARTATRKVLDVLDPSARRRATDLSHRVWVDVRTSAPRRVMSVLEAGPHRPGHRHPRLHRRPRTQHATRGRTDDLRPHRRPVAARRVVPTT